MSKLDVHKIEAGVKLILQGIGADLTDVNFKQTPQRVAKAYVELLTPRRNNYRVFPEKHDSMIILREHCVTGLCPHHLLPVRMRVWLAYIPNGKVLGLSKLARCVEDQLTAPVMQESLTDAVVDSFNERLQPKGVACTIVGKHDCMIVRGVKTNGDVVTSAVRGVFLTNPSAKEEFLRLVGNING
jgi:GTP cyclohydrolase I